MKKTSNQSDEEKLYCDQCGHELHLGKSFKHQNHKMIKTRCANDDCHVIGSTIYTREDEYVQD
ncbi:hypothetical protein [Alkalibacillus almallahensis]|uniref:hypothetical protein n=1 Tax=Alkalibacillus almallahensis TaxID=1379154 RepID=UPI0014237C9F|nr:hypothetical protein [Alkalibacillus almallahensis]NIK10877.1 hypothetical protein [Alkalibacillus almallahensis]